MLKRWASQALSPVTLMITLLLSSLKSGAKVQLIIDIDKQALSPVTLMITLLLSSLKSGAKVQLIIDIDKEKGIYLLKIRFFLQ